MGTVTYDVPDISCQGCANAISRAIADVDGVTGIAVDIDSKKVTVEYDESKARPESIEERIEYAGYDAEPVAK